MFKEITPMDALKLFLCGKDGIVIQQNEDGFSVDNFNDFFSEIERRTKFMVQTEEQQDVSEPAEEEQKVTDPFERYEKYGSYTKSKKKRHRPNQKEIEQNILKAWDCGNRSFDEVVKRTGYSAKTVERFLPHNCKA
jgi:hypothetical protein